MNKPKAPKDMTATELLEQYKKDHNCAGCKFDKYCEREEAPIIKSGESIPKCCIGRVWFEERIKEKKLNERGKESLQSNALTLLKDLFVLREKSSEGRELASSAARSS